MHVRTTAQDLAHWLELQGGNWLIEGEPTLGRSLPVPASAASLAQVLRARAGELVALAPEGCRFAEDSLVGLSDLKGAAHLVEGLHVFQLAWVTPEGVRDAWLLVEDDAAVSSAGCESTASRLLAGFRDARPSPRIARKF